MECKSIDTLSIAECCEQLNLRREDLPEALQNIIDPSEGDELLIGRLQSLLDEDKLAIESCRTIEQYEGYLSTWVDGLYHSHARTRIAQLKAAAEELAFYKTNQNSISGLETYIKKYPNGRFIQEAKGSLANKKKARKIRNIILLIIAIVIAIVVCLINYFPVSYLDVSGDVSLGKRGGNKTITISTDANDINIDVQESSNWIDVNRDGGTLSINVVPNTDDERSAYITVNTYSSFFGKKFNCISKTIKVCQSSGLPTYLKTNTSEISFDKYGNCSSNQITATTDGCDLQVSTSASWFSVSKNITEDEDNMVASIVITTGTNNEGSKTGDVVISCNNYVKRIKVSQESGLATRFELGTYNLIMAEEGCGEGFIYPVSVYTDGTSWSVDSSPDWLTAYADLEDKRLEIKVGPNYNETKKGIITLKSNNEHFIDINVTQEGDPNNFYASKETVAFEESSNYEYITIYNDSKKSLYVEEYESWLSATIVDKNKIKISCDLNYKDPPRKGNVYIGCGNKIITITITQDGWEICRRCGGNKELDCPNLYIQPWMTEFGHYIYMWDNGRHILRRAYTVWHQHAPPEPKIDDSDCSVCEGDGKIECPNCDGHGKIKKTY